MLGRPAPTDAHYPTAAQDALVTTRDRACRFPDCGQRVGGADRDHVLPHAHGRPTDCANLCCLCRSHHRLKTHAPGWRFVVDPDGTLHVTTPSGVTRTTRPPGLRRPSQPPGSRPAAPEPAPGRRMQ
ncbi:HNH endonuclease signature motif containing protein [Geodermatophilus sp. URMC 60]